MAVGIRITGTMYRPILIISSSFLASIYFSTVTAARSRCIPFIRAFFRSKSRAAASSPCSFGFPSHNTHSINQNWLDAFAVFAYTSRSVRQDWNFRFNSTINAIDGICYCITFVSASLALWLASKNSSSDSASYHISRRRFVRRRHK